MMFSYVTVKDLLMVLKFDSNSPIVHVAANTHPSLNTPAVVTCTKNLQFAINSWMHVSRQRGEIRFVAERALLRPNSFLVRLCELK